MTSVFDVIAAEDTTQRTASRKAVVLSKTRVDNEYGAFIAKHGQSALEYLEDQIKATVHIACAEVGELDPDAVVAAINNHYREAHGQEVVDVHPYPQYVSSRTASTIREARKPRMCPFHKDVVDISLASGDPRAGFDSMAQHWGGPRHCEGEGYEGDSCKFKPQMTTQEFWDERKERAEQKRKERAEREENAVEQVEEVEETEVTEEPTEEISEPVAEEPVAEDNVTEVDFETTEVEAPADETEIPMSMAASTKTADTPSPVMDKKKWTPKTEPVDVDNEDGPHPTRRKDIVEPIKPTNGPRHDPTELDEIGEQVTERQDLPSSDNAGFDSGGETGSGGTWTEGPRSAISAHDPHKNELVEIMKSDFDGFLPQAEVEQAVLAHRKR